MDILTTEDLINDALRKAGEKQDGTSEYLNDALTYMTSLHRSILSGGNEFDIDLGDPWTWAKAKYPAVLTLVPPIEDGSITLTEGSASGVFTNAPSSSVVGWWIHTLDQREFYRITAHIAGDPNFTLDGPFNGNSGAGQAYKMIKIDYELEAANILRQIGPMNVYKRQTSDGDHEGKIYGLDIRSFSKNNPFFDIKQGTPTEFAILSNENGVITVRFNKYVHDRTRVEYDYIEEPAPLENSSSSIPKIPAAYRVALSYATANMICIDKEDSKATTFFQLAQAKLQAMQAANRREFMQISKNRGRLIPRMSEFGGRNWPTKD